MTTSEVLEALDELITSRSILNHPFYTAWSAGELTREQLAVYATLYYPHVAAFPAHIEQAANLTDDPVIRKELQDNLDDELSNPKAHDELWLDFAEGLGMSREAVVSKPSHPAALNMVSTFEKHTSSETAAAVTALYAYESQQPEVSATKLDGLRKFYGISDTKTVAYFDVHAEADVRHRRGERDAIGRCLDSGASPELVLQAAENTLDAYWELLTGIGEEAGVAVVC